MLQDFDEATTQEQTQAQRAAQLALLARAPLDMLNHALTPFSEVQTHWLRKPETGLVMAQARAGGSGARFNLGEVAVTRCTVQAQYQGHRAVGVAYVAGRSHKQAQQAALADALLQMPPCADALRAHLLQPIQEQLQAQRDALRQKAQTTKVEFFTVARESGAAEDDEE